MANESTIPSTSQTTPNQDQTPPPPLYKNYDFQSILTNILTPMEIQSYINWTPQYSTQRGKWIKPPVQKINEPDTHLLLPEAFNRSSQVGLVCNDKHPIIGLDLDDVPLTEPRVAKLLSKHPTYIERSPSGEENRFRLLYRLSSTSAKKDLKPKKSLKVGDGEIELFNYSNNYITLTGRTYEESHDDIAEIPASAISALFRDFSAKDLPDNVTEFPNAPPTSNKSLVPIKIWIETVPVHRDHPLLQKYLTKHKISYHDYWLQGIMAIHFTQSATFGYQYADQWSQQSGEEYDAEELEQRWASLGQRPEYESITGGTYQYMFNECSIDWPRKNAKTKTPTPGELANYEQFLDFHGISLEVDAITTEPFLSGPAYSTIPRYYDNGADALSYRDNLQRLSTLLCQHAREYNYWPTVQQVDSFNRALLALRKPHVDYVNRFARAIDAEPAYSSNEPDYLTLLSSEILQRNPRYENPTQEFQNLLVRKWLYSVARTFWPDEIRKHKPNWVDATAEGILIISGGQGIGKSTWGRLLFPAELKHLYIQTAPNLSGKRASGQNFKDYKASVCKRLVVDFDEAGRIFDPRVNTEEDLKNEVTAHEDVFRPAWGKHELCIPRKYSILGSTNEVSLTLPREGQRRCWWLNISNVDTYTLQEWPIMRMWAQVKQELLSLAKSKSSASAPWLLNAQERSYLVSYLIPHSTTSQLEEILLEHYDWTDGYDEIARLNQEDYFKKQVKGTSATQVQMAMKTALEVTKELKLAGYSDSDVSKKAIFRVLRRLCQQHAPQTMEIGKTIITEGYVERSRQKLFLVPPPRSVFYKYEQKDDSM